MADDMKETISALMDGELTPQELADAMRQLRMDQMQRQCWQRYHMIGDAMRKNLPPHMDAGFAERVSSAISREDIPVRAPVEPSADAANNAEAVAHAHNVKPMHARRHGKSAITRPAVGFSVAASVAMVAYLGFGVMGVDDGSAMRVASNATPVVVPSASAVVVPQQVASIQPRFTVDNSAVSPVSASRWNVSAPAVESRLNTFLYDHQNVSSQASASAARVLPNARVVMHSVRESDTQ